MRLLVPCVDPVLLRAVEQRMAELWDRDHCMGLPPPTPLHMGLDRSALEAVARSPAEWVASAKLDGERMFLLLDHVAPPRPELEPWCYAVLITRKGTVFPLGGDASGTVDGAWFEGTLLDCEYVRADDALHVFDVVYYQGSDRRGGAYAPDAVDLARSAAEQLAPARLVRTLRAKPVVRCDDRAALAALITDPSASVDGAPTDGVVFTHVRRPLRHGACSEVRKFKPRPTVDLVPTPDGHLLVHDRAHVAHRRATALPVELAPADRPAEPTDAVWEYALELVEAPRARARGPRVRAVPLRPRPDKTLPNAEPVLVETLELVLTEVTARTLLDLLARDTDKSSSS